jgi:hypothetical protein
MKYRIVQPSRNGLCLRFNRDQSAVTLLTDPSFLGKNQIPRKGSEPIIIPALPSDFSSDLLCPIRMLKIYLDHQKSDMHEVSYCTAI